MYVECDCGYLITELIHACSQDGGVDCCDVLALDWKLVRNLLDEIREFVDVVRPVLLCLGDEVENTSGGQMELVVPDGYVLNADRKLDDNVLLHRVKFCLFDVRPSSNEDKLTFDNAYHCVNEVIVHLSYSRFLCHSVMLLILI